MAEVENTDRELLVLAAKASGYTEEFCPDGWTDDGPWRWHEEMKWNPLTDDGDALRLGCRIAHRYGERATTLIAKYLCQEDERHGDECAATRRAIVRAAAEIGKAMS